MSSQAEENLVKLMTKCVILACRPALFYLLKVQSSSRQGQQTSKVPRSIKGVIQVCIDCAIQAVATLSLFKEYDLLGEQYTRVTRG